MNKFPEKSDNVTLTFGRAGRAGGRQVWWQQENSTCRQSGL